MERAAQVGVGLIVTAGVNLESSAACIALAETYPSLVAGVGIHPTRVTALLDDAGLSELRRLALSSPKVVCISETGLDFGEGRAAPEVQETVFRQHVRLGREMGLPIILHDRQGMAHAQVMRVLREEGADQVGGASHYFQGTLAMAQEYVEMGFYISFGKVIIRQEGAFLNPVIRHLPLDRILTETDALPRPERAPADWTEPRHVALVAQAIAGLRGLTYEQVAAAATANLRRMLKQ